jgi:hypothetical protein
MSGFGKTPWGIGPWGGSDQEIQVQVFLDPAYVLPKGVAFGRVSLSAFSGEPTSGPLSGSSGAVFFSPALFEDNSSNKLDLAFIKFSVRAGDYYQRPQEKTSRVFRFGGGGPGWGASNLSRTNSSLYRTQPKEYFITATLTQTIPPGPTTIIKIS